MRPVRKPTVEKSTTGTKGAANELRVCADLLSKGCEVFRSVSPSCSCDLVIRQNEKLLRVEVTTARVSKATGKVLYAPHDPNKYDVLALVFPGFIQYIPSITNGN